jgi:hypothetical protein
LMFDLSRKSTLMSIKEWYRQARGLNRVSSSTIFHTQVDIFFRRHMLSLLELNMTSIQLSRPKNKKKLIDLPENMRKR